MTAESVGLLRGSTRNKLRLVASGDVEQSDATLMRAVYLEARTIARGVLRSRGCQSWGTATLVNEAFVRLLGGACAEQMRIDPTSVLPMLRRVMNNALTDQGRRERSAKRPGGRVFYNDAMIAFDDDPSTFLDILDALDELRNEGAQEAGVSEPQKLARVLELGFVLGCSTREIAGEVDLPQSTVARWLRYGRARINARLHRAQEEADGGR